AANPRWSDLRDQLGDAYDELGEHQKAAAAFEAGINATPRLAAQFARSAAQSLLLAGDLAGAEAHARLALAGNAPGAHLLLGEIALAKRDLSTASVEAQEADREPSDRVEALFLMARIAQTRGDYGGALRLLEVEEEARRKNAGSQPEHYHFVLADVLAHLGRMDEARVQFREEIAAEPRNLQAYSDLALIDFLAGNREGAMATLQEMVEKNPTKDAYLFAAGGLEKWGDKENASKFRQRAEMAGRPITR